MLLHLLPPLQSASPQQPFAAQQTLALALQRPVRQSLPDEHGPCPAARLHWSPPSATHSPLPLHVWWVVLFAPVHLSMGGQHSKVPIEQPPKLPPEQRRSPSRPQLFRQGMVLPSQHLCPGPFPQGTPHLPLPSQVRFPPQPGWAIWQHGCPWVPQVVQVPFVASVLPLQQAPAAQPRGQAVIRKALPSGMHSFNEPPSQVGAWAGLQVLHRLPLQPLPQVSSA